MPGNVLKIARVNIAYIHVVSSMHCLHELNNSIVACYWFFVHACYSCHAA